MANRTYKISEEQYKRLTENEVYSSTGSGDKPQTVVKTTKSDLSNATQKALNTNASAIEITDAGNLSEGIVSKKDFISEARKEWKDGTKVVKMSELLKK